MSTPSANPPTPSNRRIAQRCVLLCAIAGLGAISATAQAAGANTAVVAMHTLKTQLVKLRDITVSSLAPSVYFSGRSDEYTGALRNADDRLLFKPLRAEAYAAALQQSLTQPMGVQLSDRTQLHCDFTRYHTADDQREISLKVGINVGFR